MLILILYAIFLLVRKREGKKVLTPPEYKKYQLSLHIKLKNSTFANKSTEEIEDYVNEYCKNYDWSYYKILCQLEGVEPEEPP